MHDGIGHGEVIMREAGAETELRRSVKLGLGTVSRDGLRHIQVNPPVRADQIRSGSEERSVAIIREQILACAGFHGPIHVGANIGCDGACSIGDGEAGKPERMSDFMEHDGEEIDPIGRGQSSVVKIPSVSEINHPLRVIRVGGRRIDPGRQVLLNPTALETGWRVIKIGPCRSQGPRSASP